MNRLLTPAFALSVLTMFGCTAATDDPTAPTGRSPVAKAVGTPAVPQPPAVSTEPVLPIGRELVALFPADARDFLHQKQVPTTVLSQFAVVPGSFKPTGELTLRRVVTGRLAVVRLNDQWRAAPLLLPGADVTESMIPLAGIPADVNTPEALATWFQSQPDRVLTAKSAGNKPVAVATLAGLAVESRDLGTPTVTAAPDADVPAVSLLSFTFTGREIPATVEVVRDGSRWQVTGIRTLAGVSPLAFLKGVIK